jgi:hypothetical protein
VSVRPPPSVTLGTEFSWNGVGVASEHFDDRLVLAQFKLREAG